MEKVAIAKIIVYFCIRQLASRQIELLIKGGIHMTKEEKKADFLRRFRASRERKEEYLSKIEMRMREDYRIRTGKEAESFNVL